MFTTILCVVYTTVVWLLLFLFPRFFIGLFSNGNRPAWKPPCPVCTSISSASFMMSLQMAGQSAAVALGRSKQAVFFSLFRKVVIVAPLTLLLPHLFGLGVTGVFLAEPISNFIGGAACYITMLLHHLAGDAAERKSPPYRANLKKSTVIGRCFLLS